MYTHTHMSVLGLNDSVATATGGPVGHVFLCVEKGFRGILGVDGQWFIPTSIIRGRSGIPLTETSVYDAAASQHTILLLLYNKIDTAPKIVFISI